jgi:hypothetical protein
MEEQSLATQLVQSTLSGKHSMNKKRNQNANIPRIAVDQGQKQPAIKGSTKPQLNMILMGGHGNERSQINAQEPGSKKAVWECRPW